MHKPIQVPMRKSIAYMMKEIFFFKKKERKERVKELPNPNASSTTFRWFLRDPCLHATICILIYLFKERREPIVAGIHDEGKKKKELKNSQIYMHQRVKEHLHATITPRRRQQLHANGEMQGSGNNGRIQQIPKPRRRWAQMKITNGIPATSRIALIFLKIIMLKIFKPINFTIWYFL